MRRPVPGRDWDVPGRLLTLAVRQLPSGRHEWGQAMEAEFVGLETRQARWLFALGCTKVALSRPSTAIRIFCLGTVMAVGAILAGQAPWPERPGAIMLLLALPAVAWIGRRSGRFGPVKAGRVARAVRAGGYTALSICFLLYIRGLRYPTQVRPGSVTTTVGLVLWVIGAFGLYAVAVLVMTAHRSRLSAVSLATGTGFGLITGLAGFAVLPYERVLPPLGHGLPGSGLWLDLVAVSAPVAAGVLASRRTGRGIQGSYAALCSGVVAALVIFIVGEGAVLLMPDRVPDIVRPDVGARLRLSRNIEEAIDPYLAILLVGDAVIVLTGIMLILRRRWRRYQTGH